MSEFLDEDESEHDSETEALEVEYPGIETETPGVKVDPTKTWINPEPLLSQIAHSFGATHFSMNGVEVGIPVAGTRAVVDESMKDPGKDATLADQFMFRIRKLRAEGLYIEGELATQLGRLIPIDNFVRLVEKLIKLGVDPDVAAKQASKLLASEKEVLLSSLKPSQNRY